MVSGWLRECLAVAFFETAHGLLSWFEISTLVELQDWCEGRTLGADVVIKHMAKQKQKLQVKIVFDTNAIWTGGESYLLRQEIADLVGTTREDVHLEIAWILPEVVLHERLHQMFREAIALLPSLARLEKVIGHPLNITEAVVFQRISESVERQIAEHKLVIQQASYANVDWQRLVGDAVNRRPPFELKSEKGFRDAIIVETFLQLVEASPDQPQRCRIVLLTNDALLTRAAKGRLDGRNNVQVFGSVDELKGLINTLISTVPEDYVAKMQVRAKEYFVKSQNPDKGFYFDMKVRDAVETKCLEQLATKPEGTSRRSNSTWQLAHLRFVRKEGQRMFWASRFSIEAKAYKELPSQDIAWESAPGINVASSYNTLWSPTVPTLWKGIPATVVNVSGSPTEYYGKIAHTGGVKVSSLFDTETLAATGKTVIDVTWSASVNVKGVFTKPRIEAIDFVETMWDKVA